MISAIVAIDENYGIGYNNELLCSIKEDLERFKKLTTNNVVVMGRKTWDSLPKKPLPNRHNIVVTNKPLDIDKFTSDYFILGTKLELLKKEINELSEYYNIFIIGGGQIYKELLPYCNHIHLTKIYKAFENVDTYFPRFNENGEWELESEKDIRRTKDGIEYQFLTYKRKEKIMKKQVFIINGSGGVGKDTFVNLIRSNFVSSAFTPVANFSSVDKVKEIAKKIGWDGKSKTEKDRKFLSDLKLLCTEYNNMPFNSMDERVYSFHKSDSVMLFLHIREPEEIERAKNAFNAKTILVKRDSIKHITSNMADENVFNYNYDIVINNNGTIKEFEMKANKFIDDFINDNIKKEY